MTRRRLTEVMRYLQRLANPERVSGLSDAELLERYVRHRDEAAFELLLWRHGVLVFNVCRRVLSREQDAEDAFQATFLAFVRKAHSISRGGSVSSWLYKVAYRVALEARERARKTAAREKPDGEALAIQPSPDSIWDDIRPILDEEINRLPERLRQPFILCYLEGKTNEEAARQLGCRPGTIFSRLARGRELLRKRLVHRGVTLSAAMLTAALGRHAAEAMPAALLRTATLRAALSYASGSAAGAISIQVTTLAEGVLRTMFLTKLKMAALGLLIVGLLAGGGVLTQHVLKAAPQAEAREEAPSAQPKDARKNDEEKTVVRVVRPKPGGLEHISVCTGIVRAAAQQQVYSAISGILKRPLVDIGDHVKKGDVLVEIDAPLLVKDAEQAAAALQLAKGQHREAKARIATAEADLKVVEGRIKECERKLKSDQVYLDFRKKQSDRYQSLLAARSIDARLVEEQEERREAAQEAVLASKEALATARAAATVAQAKIESVKAALTSAEASLKMAEIALDKARLKVSFTHIHANFDGVVVSRNCNTGELISASDQGTPRPLLTVMRFDAMRVVVDVPESDALLARPGVLADLSVAVLPDETFLGRKVSRIGFALDEHSKSMPVEIDVPNPKGLLRPGLTIQAALHLAPPSPKAFTLPLSCFYRGLLKNNKGLIAGSIYVVRDGKAHRTRVRLGHSNGREVEILSGVQADDRVVADPHGNWGEVVPVQVERSPR